LHVDGAQVTPKPQNPDIEDLKLILKMDDERTIKVIKTTDTKIFFTINCNVIHDEVNIIKKRILKKLEVPGYKDQKV
jgi:hypothetical protein